MPPEERLGKYVGASVTFRTAKPAPAHLDAWTFYWRAPWLEATKGRMRFSTSYPFRFSFFDQDESGKINWERPSRGVVAHIE